MSRPVTARRDRRPDDAGYSLIEVLVTMGIMSVVLTMFTTAIVSAYRATGSAEKRSIAQSELHRGFQRFDRELRYASWIAAPGQVGSTWYVEFAGVGGTECLQLRLEPGTPAANPGDGTGILQLLRWTPGSPPAQTARGQTVASHLVIGAVAPFERQAANTSPYASSDFITDFQRLRIRLTSRVDDATSDVDTTFTALNTSRATAATHPCQEGRPTP